MVYFSSWFFSGCLSLSGEIDAELFLGLVGDSLVKLELVKLLSSSKSCTFISVFSTSVPNLFASYGLLLPTSDYDVFNSDCFTVLFFSAMNSWLFATTYTYFAVLPLSFYTLGLTMFLLNRAFLPVLKKSKFVYSRCFSILFMS